MKSCGALAGIFTFRVIFIYTYDNFNG